jgi:1,2-dihydroxy-3-keto-5-methylthiopentene dioxygenase
MARAYWFDNSPEDQRAPHDSGKEVPEATLKALGIHLFHYPNLADVDALAASRDYKNRDEVTISPAAMGDIYESKVKGFFHEHLHGKGGEQARGSKMTG